MRSAKLGVSSSERSLMPVTGHVLFPLSSQRWMHDRSYVWPVTTITGSTMSSMDTGHEKCAGTGIFGLPPSEEGVVAIAPRTRRGEQTTKRPGGWFFPSRVQQERAGPSPRLHGNCQGQTSAFTSVRIRDHARCGVCLCARGCGSGEVNLPRHEDSAFGDRAFDFREGGISERFRMGIHKALGILFPIEAEAMTFA